MYALIYDDFDLSKPWKPVISVHKTRELAEKALQRRQQKLGRRVWECYSRIVWVDRPIKTGETVESEDFETWRPGEKIPAGEVFTTQDYLDEG